MGGLAVRLPYLADVPRFTDEVREVEVALDFARGGELPLTNFDTYIGAFSNYLVAAIFAVFGADPLYPRVLTAVGGALTVALTYLLGAVLVGRPAGLIAALLLLLNAHHVLENHIAYSHSLTPLLATVTLTLLALAVRRLDEPVPPGPRHPPPGTLPLLVGGGFALGLTLQSHPTTVALVPGLAAVLLPAFLRRRVPAWWAVPGALATLLGMANLVVFNVLNDGEGLQAGAESRDTYAKIRDPLSMATLPAYAGSVIQTLRWILVGTGRADDAASVALQVILTAAFAGAAALGLRELMGHRRWFGPAVLAGWLVVLTPIAAYRIELPRYWMPVLPVLLVVVATGFLRLGRLLSTRAPRLRAVVPALVGALIVASHGQVLADRYARVPDLRPTNAEMRALATQVLGELRPGEHVLVDERLFAGPPTETHPPRTLTHLLRLANREAAWMRNDSITLRRAMGNSFAESHLVVTLEPFSVEGVAEGMGFARLPITPAAAADPPLVLVRLHVPPAMRRSEESPPPRTPRPTATPLPARDQGLNELVLRLPGESVDAYEARLRELAARDEIPSGPNGAYIRDAVERERNRDRWGWLPFFR